MVAALHEVYFKPVNPHQFFPAVTHAEEEQNAAYDGVRRLVYFYTDPQDRLMLMVVFKHPGEFNPDRICGFQADLGPAQEGVNRLPGYDLAEAGQACEAYWQKDLQRVFGGARRDPKHPRYTGTGEPPRPSGHAG